MINEDVIIPSQGFGMHPHKDMEIITYMLHGEFQHKDILGNNLVIRAGDALMIDASSFDNLIILKIAHKLNC